MRLIFTIIFLVCLVSVVEAQADTVSGSSVVEPLDQELGYPSGVAKLIVKTDLLPMLDVYNGGNFRLGAEYLFNVKNSVYLEGGGLYYPLGNGMKNIKGFVGKAEYRYYYTTYPNGYFSLEYHIKKQSLDYGDTIKIDNVDPYWKEYSVSKLNHNINAKWGWQAHKNRFVLDYYVGLGVRFKDASCTGLTEEEAESREHYDSMSLPETFNCGGGTYLTMTMGLRVGLKIF